MNSEHGILTIQSIHQFTLYRLQIYLQYENVEPCEVDDGRDIETLRYMNVECITLKCF